MPPRRKSARTSRRTTPTGRSNSTTTGNADLDNALQALGEILGEDPDYDVDAHGDGSSSSEEEELEATEGDSASGSSTEEDDDEENEERLREGRERRLANARPPEEEDEEEAPPATDEEEERTDKLWDAALAGDLDACKREWFPGATLERFRLDEMDSGTAEADRYAVLEWLMIVEAAEPYDSFVLGDDKFIEICQRNRLDPTDGYEGEWCPLHFITHMGTDELMLKDVQWLHKHLPYFLQVLCDESDPPVAFFNRMAIFAKSVGFKETLAFFASIGVHPDANKGLGEWPLPPDYVRLPESFEKATGQRYGPPDHPSIAQEAAEKEQRILETLEQITGGALSASASDAAAAGAVSKVVNTPDTVVTGNGFTVNGIGCTVNGDDNTVNGAFCTVTGNRNTVTGNSCSVKGEDNTVTGKDCTVQETKTEAAAAGAASASAETTSAVDYPVFKNQRIVRIAARTAFVRGKNTMLIVENRDGSMLVEDTRVPRGTRVHPVRGVGAVVRFDSLATAAQFWRENGDDEMETKLVTAMKFDEPCGELDDTSECALCCTNKRSIAFVPCGHANTCAKCVLQLVESSTHLACPWCKTAAEDVMWIRF